MPHRDATAQVHAPWRGPGPTLAQRQWGDINALLTI
jgi:hypothetical protein